MEKNNKTGRRGFLAGMLAGVGATAVVAATARTSRAEKPGQESNEEGPILYRRTKDVERYYKTLYS